MPDDLPGPLAHFTVEEDGTLRQNVAVVRSTKQARVLVGPPGAEPGDPGWRDLGFVTMIDAAAPSASLSAAQRLATHGRVALPPAGPDYPLPVPSGWTLRGASLTLDLHRVAPALRRLLFGPDRVVPPGHFLG